ncbi:MAG: sensor domain-containing diguanylate cyclase [Acidobacteria bacterium]|nr:MAG: sensor domain-containing diguanylate cyclase [Acidobacteriota bacterium]
MVYLLAAVAAVAGAALVAAVFLAVGQRRNSAGAGAPIDRKSVRRSREFEILTRIGTTLSSSLDTDSLLQTIYEQLQTLMPVDSFYLAFQEREANRIRFVFEVENRERRAPRTRERKRGVTEHVIEMGRPLLIDHDLMGYLAANGLVLSGMPARTWMGVPMRAQGKVEGVMSVQNDRCEYAYDTGHLHVLEVLAAQAGVALDNARLFAEIQQQAVTDALTGLKTRRFFMQALESEWRRAQSALTQPAREGAGECGFALVLIDLDGFKRLNDHDGHLEGDRLLVHVGHLLQSSARAGSIVARFGGDEFTVLAPACNPANAQLLPERMAAMLAADPLLRERSLGASIGLAVYPGSGFSPEELLHAADAEMYRAKQSHHHRARAPIAV